MILFVSVLALVFAGISFAAEKDLVAYWNFDEGTGTAVKDQTALKHDGKLVGTASWVDGKFGKAIEFDGKTAYVEVAHADDLAIDTTLTFSVWFRPSVTINAANNGFRLMTKNNDYFFLFNYTDAATGKGLGQLGFLLKDPAGTNHVAHSVTAEWKAGTWYHVAGTFDGKQIKIYINGILETTTDYVGKIGATKLALWIGADDAPSYFPGAIDEVRIYKATSTDAEVKQIMAGPTGVSAVKFSDKSVTSAWGKIKEAR
jgi:hypothetical protein